MQHFASGRQPASAAVAGSQPDPNTTVIVHSKLSTNGSTPAKQTEPARLLEHMAPVPTTGKVMCRVVGIAKNHKTLPTNEISPCAQGRISSTRPANTVCQQELWRQTCHRGLKHRLADCLPCATVRKPSPRIHAVNTQTATCNKSPFCPGANNAGLSERPAPATKTSDLRTPWLGALCSVP